MTDPSSPPPRARWTRRGLVAAAGVATVYAGSRFAFSRATQCREVTTTSGARLASLDEALVRLDQLERAPKASFTGAWSRFQVLEHCAQSIEYSLVGYPENKPSLIRRTVGQLVLHHFLEQGCLRHDLSAPLPGAPAIARDGDAHVAMARLQKAIHDFQRYSGPLAPHFVYGEVSKQQYDAVHAMHIADHLTELGVA